MRDTPSVAILVQDTPRARLTAGLGAAIAAAVRDTPSVAILVPDTPRARLTAGLGAASAAAVRLASRARAPTCELRAAGPGTHDGHSGTLLFDVGECGARRAAQRDAGIRRCGVRARLSLLGARAVARARARASTPLTIHRHRPALDKPLHGVLDFIDVIDGRRIRASNRAWFLGRALLLRFLLVLVAHRTVDELHANRFTKSGLVACLLLVAPSRAVRFPCPFWYPRR